MRILEGVGTLIQLGGLMARLCKMCVLAENIRIGVDKLISLDRNMKPELFKI